VLCGARWQKRKANDEPESAAATAAAAAAATSELPEPMHPATGAPPSTVALLNDQIRRRSECEPPPTVAVKQAGRLTSAEDKLLAHLLSRKLNADSAPITTVHSPHHHELNIAHLPAPRFGSADAGASTLQKRSALNEMVLRSLAVPEGGGGADRHVGAQLRSIVKREPDLYSAALEAVSGVEAGQRMTVDDLVELKRLTG
jgi:hypothetical protein